MVMRVRGLVVGFVALVVVVAVVVALAKWAVRDEVIVLRVGTWDGQRLAAAVARFGEPEHAETFRRSEIAGEFHIELLNRPVSPDDPDPQYMEARWDRGRHWLSLWLEQRGGEWVVVDGLLWRKDVVF